MTSFVSHKCPLCGCGCRGRICAKCRLLHPQARRVKRRRRTIDTRAAMRDFLLDRVSLGTRLAAGFAAMGCDAGEGY